ncbi:hypothetical protein [Algoriphagus terrigena]|uniref:hypothetical protein n=1 Tax=Algoriphagus terrigena TaxID=344884 RepID=UPI0004006463|nr:hypothetical protein [Algoriphagus terrigena]
MQKKSKLSIKHYHGNELEKIGKSSAAFPLYVMVRYKNVKTRFASRFGIRYVKQNGGDAAALSGLNREVINIIDADVKHIEMLRDYFEDCLGVEFTPSMVVDEFYESTALENVADFFDQILEDKELKLILLEIDQDLIDLLEAAGPIRFLSGLRHLDSDLFDRIMEIETVKEVFEYYEIYKSLNWQEVDRLQFRMAQTDDNKDLIRLKKWLDVKFDAEMRHRYDLNPINLTQ